jgi:hypothetical protein
VEPVARRDPAEDPPGATEAREAGDLVLQRHPEIHRLVGDLANAPDGLLDLAHHVLEAVDPGVESHLALHRDSLRWRVDVI